MLLLYAAIYLILKLDCVFCLGTTDFFRQNDTWCVSISFESFVKTQRTQNKRLWKKIVFVLPTSQIITFQKYSLLTKNITARTYYFQVTLNFILSGEFWIGWPCKVVYGISWIKFDSKSQIPLLHLCGYLIRSFDWLKVLQFSSFDY